MIEVQGSGKITVSNSNRLLEKKFMRSFENVRILAIESSCDETAAAIVENGKTLISSVVASQIDIHERYGGVFPEVASRQHVLSILPVVKKCLEKGHMSLRDMDAIAVTSGPGLAGSLVVGLNTAKGLAIGANKPLIGVNHLEGHIYSAWIESSEKAAFEEKFPVLVLLVSGGHTELILMRDHLKFEKIGATKDDAVGEAFDKTARLIGLGYPGGPKIEIAAKNGDPEAFNFPSAKLDTPYDFSFSGLKTAVLRVAKNYEKDGIEMPVVDIAASFQKVVIDTLIKKTKAAIDEYGITRVIVAGGVSANKALREGFNELSDVEVIFPPFEFCTDNAAMIGAAAYQRFIKGHVSNMDIDVQPNWVVNSGA